MLSRRGQNYLTTGDVHDPFLPKLLSAVNGATEIDLAVAFVKATGLALLFDPLRDALISGARLRVLTGDYLCVTDAEALRTLLILQEEGADVRVFRSDGKSFHMKAYIFVDNRSGVSSGHAFVGSSNISQSALQHGLEWNLRVEQCENPIHFREIREKFEELFRHKKCETLSNAWIEEYNARIPRVRPIVAEEPGADEILTPPEPNAVQSETLVLLQESRSRGNKRGLVVLATGMGKTWLAAFDVRAFNAKRILFVAHREEILAQAEETFVRVRPTQSIGRYTGQHHDVTADLTFASIQTLGKSTHLQQFPRDYFDYIIVDEFHHAAARTYRQLLCHFTPRFLLGLTATPDRTDQADILSLCDNNLVISNDLFTGIANKLLCPFHYYGIGDESVDYSNIPWRNGRFDPNSLEHALATHARARHILQTWLSRKLTRTLAFCASHKHADYMAEYFNRYGHRAVSVHSESPIRRSTALEQLRNQEIDVIFSVDLFNEGVDLPRIDTVLMIRPTDSKIIFLQQLGRGLRRSLESGKGHLVVLDFIGNHLSFFRKAEALFGLDGTGLARREFLRKVQEGHLSLPTGCYVNYDLQAIAFLEALCRTRVDSQVEIYRSLVVALGYRPTLSQFYNAGGAITTIQKETGGWFQFVGTQGDLTEAETSCLEHYATAIDFVFQAQSSSRRKYVLLETFLEAFDTFGGISTRELSRHCFESSTARWNLKTELPAQFAAAADRFETIEEEWKLYWRKQFLEPWVSEQTRQSRTLFDLSDLEMVRFSEPVLPEIASTLADMLSEYAEFRMNQVPATTIVKPTPTHSAESTLVEVPFFPDLRIACGHFTASEHEESTLEYRAIPARYGKLDSKRHFLATARGNSMNGGKHPIKSGDILLLDLIGASNAGSNSDKVIAIERQDASGDDQYLLRYVRKNGPNNYTLHAWNSDYEDLTATEDMRTFARLRGVIDPLEFNLHHALKREDIPPLFGLEFNQGLWNMGHIFLKERKEHVLLVSLSKQGRIEAHRYHDYFESPEVFHWQSQNKTTPVNARGTAIVNQGKLGTRFHLFVRRNRMLNGLGAPFHYCGPVHYLSHTGEAPMNVVWRLEHALSQELTEQFL